MCLKNHRTCEKFNNIKGVGALLILPQYSNSKNGICVPDVVLLGRERYGQYANEYNLCGGRMESIDKGCVIRAITREILEEFKMDLSESYVFDLFFKGNNGFDRCFTKGNTLIFVGILPRGFSRKGIKHKMLVDCNDHSKDSAYREMDDVEYFNSYNLRQIEGKNCNVSSYAASVIQKATQKGFI